MKGLVLLEVEETTPPHLVEILNGEQFTHFISVNEVVHRDGGDIGLKITLVLKVL